MDSPNPELGKNPGRAGSHVTQRGCQSNKKTPECQE